jgi:hypothetical protein
VEKDKIHLYFHLIYVKRPAKIAKKEYHNLVSPVVLNGGRSRLIHKPQINTAKAHADRTDMTIAAFLLSNKDSKDAVKAAPVAQDAKYMNTSQLISLVPL